MVIDSIPGIHTPVDANSKGGIETNKKRGEGHEGSKGRA